MNIQNFHINTVAIYQPGVTTGDTISMQLTHVTGGHLIDFEPLMLTYATNFFTAQIECVIDISQEDLTEGKIWLIDGDGYYNYVIKKNGSTIESGQVFIQAPQQTIIENNPNNSVIITQFGAGSSGSSGNSGTNGISGTNGLSGTSGLTGSSGSSGKNGTNGLNGTSGINGLAGSSGSSGANGQAGSSGSSGKNGTNGLNGSSGSSGQTGASGSSGVSGSSGSSGVDGITAGRTYYFNNSQNSDVNPYKLLTPVPSGAAQQTITKTLTNNQQNVLVQEFLTAPLGFSVIPGGTQRFHSHFLKQASNDQIQTYATIQLANSAGVGIGPILSTGNSEIGWVDASTPVEVTTDLTLSTTTIDPTNRMIVKIYVSNNDSSSHNVVWYTEGTSYYAFVNTSVGASAATSGSSGMSGSSGTSAGGGGASTLVTGVTLSSASWSYNAPYYEYTYSNAAITTSTVVDFTPYNASVAECIISAVYPYVQVSAGSCKFYADNAPTTNITGDVLITTTI